MKNRYKTLFKLLTFLFLFLGSGLAESAQASSFCDDSLTLSERVFAEYSVESKKYIAEIYNTERLEHQKREKGDLFTAYSVEKWEQPFSKRLSWGVGLASRLKASEDHAVWLKKLGYEFEKRAIDGKDVLTPPAQPEIIFSRANRFIQEAIERGELTEDQAIYLAIPFESVKKNFTAPLTIKSISKGPTGDFIFVRPGLDPIPPESEYKINFKLPQLPALVWEQTLASGKMPVSLGGFLDHDMGHYTEFLSDLDIMKATREFYKKAANRSAKWRKATSDRDFWPQHPQAAYFMIRALFFAESFAVPDLKKADQIKQLLPHLFEKSDLSDLQTEKQRLNGLAVLELLSETDQFLTSYDHLILRQGGSSRDSYNYVRLATDKSNENFMEYSAAHGHDKVKDLYDPILSTSSENLLNAQYVIAEVVRKLRLNLECSSCGGLLQTIYKDLLIDRLARAEIAFANGIKLNVKPAQIIRDSGEVTTNRNSITSRWLSTFVVPNSYLWKAFLSHESQAEPTEF